MQALVEGVGGATLEVGLRCTPKLARRLPNLQDVWAMLQVLSDVKARAAIGLTWLGGLNPSEARGALWQNYDAVSLKITQSVMAHLCGADEDRSARGTDSNHRALACYP